MEGKVTRNRIVKKFLELLHFQIYRDRHEEKLKSLFNYLRPIEYPLTRIGGISDGSYLLPNCLEGIELCFSPGSNKIWDFERELLENYKIKSALIDNEYNKPDHLPPEINYTSSWIGLDDDSTYTSFESWAKLNPTSPNSDLMLQMDIEGDEYKILFNMPNHFLKRFRVLTIEFHYSSNFKNSELYLNHYEVIFSRLRKYFTVVHFHGNNCCGTWKYRNFELPHVFELTLLRNDWVPAERQYAVLPHHLDVDNVESNPTLLFNFPES
jgi:hypothetical protein